ncbi:MULTISPECIES: MFS transporter [Gordonibacter]|uniref:MFS transporter n=2 Tax=Gordonibacter TaxID=644652 RepID=A0ABT7DN28_9ACTN|nr:MULTISPECIES: MFS transporter [unclassified Gordonibacter]MDJ1650627.1 MFS transporter [Gordonibacter sp. KGMB12511]HIW75795.1 MFS transporter [Candidatus Gordonibacter avicola]
MSNSTIRHRSKLSTKATLLLCACDSNALGSEMTPILAVMALAFPGENVNLLVALPPLCIIPASLIAAKLSYYISRKTILTVGQLLFVLGGIGGAFAPNFEVLLFTRVLFGLGCGLVYPIVPTLISYFFAGQERAGMMGGANAVGSIIAMVFSTLSGTLAVIGWHVPFFVNVFFVFVLIMQIIFLPKVPPEKDLAFAQEAAALSPEQRRIGGRAWMGILLMFVSMTIGMVYLLKMAIFIQESGIGDSVMAGFASSSTTFTALLISLVFAQIFKHLRRYTVLVPMAAIAASFTLLAFATTPAGVFVGAIVYGIYLGTIIPYLQTALSGLVHPCRRTFALSALSIAMFAGQACSSIYVAFAEGVVGGSTTALFELMSAMFAVLFVVVLVYLVLTRKDAAYPYGDVTE